MIIVPNLIFLVCFTLVIANSPYSAPNPHIKTGRYDLIQSHGVFPNSAVSQEFQPEELIIFQYEIQFPTPFQNIPSVALGLFSYQYSPASFNNQQTFLDMNTSMQSQNSFQLNLIMNLNNYNFISQLTINYLSVVRNNCPQIITMQHLVLQTSNFLLQDQTQQNFTFAIQAFSSSLLFIDQIVGHHFYSRLNYCQIHCSMINLQNYKIKIYRQYSVKIKYLFVYIVIIDRSISNQASRYYFQKYPQCLEYNETKNQLFQNNLLNQNSYFVGVYVFFFNQKTTINEHVGFKISFQQNGKVENYPQYNQICINTFSFEVYQCDNQYYYDKQSNSCVSQCRQAIDKRYCLTCIDYCQHCINHTTCQQCVETRQLNQDFDSCVCKVGYQQDNNQQECFNCQIYSVGCISCNKQQEKCLLCNADNYFKTNTNDSNLCQCSSNSKLDENTLKCLCIEKYYQNEGVCSMCHISCKKCIESNSFDKCTECDNQVFRLQSGSQCVCNFPFVELCNNITQDCNGTVCYFDSSIQVEISLINITKNSDKNSLLYIVKLIPELDLFKQFDLRKVIELGFQSTIDDNLKFENQVLTFQAEYFQNIHGINAEFKFQLQSHGSLSFSQTKSVTFNYNVLPTNNLEANYYPQTDYTITQNLTYTVYVLLGLTLIIFIVGLYSSKIVVSQMVGIIQLSYYGLFLIDYKSPLMVPLTLLRYSNGYNDILPQSFGIIPLKIQKVGFNELIFANLNTMILVTIVPLILSLLLFIASKVIKKDKQRNKSFCKLCLGQWMMVAILFILYNANASTVIFSFYSTTRDWMSIVSIVEICVCFVLLVYISLMYILTDYNYFGQFKYMFKWKTFELNYYLFQIGIRVVSGILLAVAHFHFASGIAITVMFLFLSIITIIKKPYADNLQTFRSVTVTFIGAFIMGMYSTVAATGYSKGKSFQSKVPIIIISLLFFVVAISGYFIIRQFIKSYQVQKQFDQPSDLIQQQTREQQQFMRKQIQQTYKDGGHNNFARKLYIQKNRQMKKKKKQIRNIQQQKQKISKQQKSNKNKKSINQKVCRDRSETIINRNTIEVLGNSFGESDEINYQLTVQRFHMVDQMLKQGLI